MSCTTRPKLPEEYLRYIQTNPCHRLSHNLPVYNSMSHRLINEPMNKENFKLEMNRIHVISKNKDYSTDLINTILLKTQKSKTISFIYPKVLNVKSNKYNSLRCYGNPSSTICELIKTADNEPIAFKTDNLFGQVIKTSGMRFHLLIRKLVFHKKINKY